LRVLAQSLAGMHVQKNGSRLLLKAASGRNIDGFIGLVHAWRVSYTQVDERGYDVSHVAVERGSVRFVSWLLENYGVKDRGGILGGNSCFGLFGRCLGAVGTD
jgi:hypothetical protein